MTGQLPVQGVGHLQNQRAVVLFGVDSVGEPSLVVDDVYVVDVAEDVVETELGSGQLAGAVVLQEGGSQEVVGEGDVRAKADEVGDERSFAQIDIVEAVAGVEGQVLVRANFASQSQRSLGAAVEVPDVHPDRATKGRRKNNCLIWAGSQGRGRMV